MPGGERVIKIDDRDNETDKLPQRENESDSERGTLGGENKHGADADVLSERVTD